MKEEWARLRCGNIGRAGTEGYEDWKLSGKEDESINHVRMCDDSRELIKVEWRRENQGGGAYLETTKATAGGPGTPALCEYLRALKKSAKKISDYK